MESDPLGTFRQLYQYWSPSVNISTV